MVVTEENPRVIHSPSHKQMYTDVDDRHNQRTESPSRYSYTVDALKALMLENSPLKKAEADN
jgi:hypothetical protein